MSKYQEFYYHGVSEPLCMTSSWFKKHEGNTLRTSMSYSRTSNPNNTIIYEKIEEIYGCERVLLFPSGINAIASCFEIFANKNSTVLVADEVYKDSSRALKYMKKRNVGFQFEKFDLYDSKDLIRLAKKHKETLKIIFLESCSNPGGLILDPSVFKEIKNIVSEECIIIVDNSWLSSTFNPFEMLAEYDLNVLVVESLTKYMGGGRIVMGMVCGKRKLMKPVYEYYKIMGTHVSPFDCWCLSEMLETLELRMNFLSTCTIQIAKFLESRKDVNRVMYPLLESHPTYSIAKKLLSHGPGIIFFHVSKEKSEIIKMCNSSKMIMYATSYGKNISLFGDIASGCHSDYDKSQKKKKKIHGTWIRIAVGWNINLKKTLIELDRLLTMETKETAKQHQENLVES